MRSRKPIILCLIIVMISSIFSLVIKVDNQNKFSPSEVKKVEDIKPKASFQTFNELWIDNSIYGCGNGTWADIAGAYSWCVDVNGDGSLYLIENITLNNLDGIGSPLIIANSTVDFVIQNCTFSNSDNAALEDAGLTLLNVSNGNIFSCNISNNDGHGVFVDILSINNTIKNNTINNNDDGIFFQWDGLPNYAINNTITNFNLNGIDIRSNGVVAENNTVVGGEACILATNGDKIVIRNNTLSGSQYGILATAFTSNLTISGNTMTNVGIYFEQNDVGFRSMEIYANNTVNGNPVYYFKDQKGLNTANFTSVGNPGQILLFNCSYSTISSFNISYTSVGIQLDYHSSHNNITHNKLRDNYYGIKLSYYCENNTIKNNTVKNAANTNIQLEYYNCNNTIIGNTATGGYRGIQVIHYNEDNEITKNDAKNNGYSGIEIFNSYNNNITHNIANENNLGIFLTQSADINFVFNNTCNDNVYGIELWNGCIDNFILENNCTDTSRGFLQARGIYISYSLRNDIINNTIYNNNERGIFIESNSEENNISLNDIRFGKGMGIYLAGACNNNTIYKNNISENSNYGIQLWAACDDNHILENEIISNLESGVYIQGQENCVYNNDIIHNGYSGAFQGGIYLNTALWNNITDNNILLNDDFGIYFNNADYNNIILNDIKNNTYGIFTTANSDYNMFYLNNFTDNTIHGWDQSIRNYWDNGTIGNYWDNYTGSDANDDGIGDTPHVILGGGGAVDHKPIWWDGEGAPGITINSPSEGQLCNATVPFFNVLITGTIDKQWFSFFNGSVWTDNATWTGVEIDQTLWNTAANGSIIVRFWANNSNGETLAERFLYKDILAPNLVIVNPGNFSLHKKTERDFDYNVQEFNLDKMWYSIEGVGRYEFTQNGSFDQAAWDAAWEATSDGNTFTIRFYANDTVGNIKYVDILITVDKSVENVNDDDDDDEEPTAISIGFYSVLIVIISIISLAIIVKYKKSIKY